MDKETINSIFNRVKGQSGIPSFREGQNYMIVGDNGPEAVLPIQRDGIRKSIALMSGVAVHKFSVQGGDIEQLDEEGRGSSPGYQSTRPLGDFVSRAGQPAQPISQDDVVFGMKDPSSVTGGGQVTIGPVNIYASTYEAGKAAERGFTEEMSRRGVQFSR